MVYMIVQFREDMVKYRHIHLEAGGEKNLLTAKNPVLPIVTGKYISPKPLSNSSSLQKRKDSNSPSISSYNSYQEKVRISLNEHPLIKNRELFASYTLEETLKYMSLQPFCLDKPIFTSMGNIYSDLYWQM